MRKAGRRALKKLESGTAVLDNIKDAEGATWLDVDEDVSSSRLPTADGLLTSFPILPHPQGTLDILVQRSGSQHGASRKLTFIKNNYFHDAFFLKALGKRSQTRTR